MASALFFFFFVEMTIFWEVKWRTELPEGFSSLIPLQCGHDFWREGTGHLMSSAGEQIWKSI